jgi:redox-sensitive bicupin YhaK (pirin superfamily)
MFSRVLTHKGSMGHRESLGPNEIQRMSAGSGIAHSEFNASKPSQSNPRSDQPATTGGPSSYQQPH